MGLGGFQSGCTFSEDRDGRRHSLTAAPGRYRWPWGRPFLLVFLPFWWIMVASQWGFQLLLYFLFLTAASAS